MSNFMAKKHTQTSSFAFALLALIPVSALAPTLTPLAFALVVTLLSGYPPVLSSDLPSILPFVLPSVLPTALPSALPPVLTPKPGSEKNKERPKKHNSLIKHHYANLATVLCQTNTLNIQPPQCIVR